jgi:chromosome segregation ATPase
MENTEKKTNGTPRPVRQTPPWLQAILRWGLVILVAFTLGALLITLIFHQPLRQEYKRVSNELESATDEITGLSDQVTDLTVEVTELTTTNENLQLNLDNAGLQQAITSALAEVRATRIAIVTGDHAGARLSITQAIQSLRSIQELIDKDNLDIVTDMLNKAEQANTDLQTDLTLAIPAMELLDTNLLSLFKTLFPAQP